jgi:sugar (pentulose or hexulose) kinase
MAIALGLDIGTTSLAAVAVDQDGRLSAIATAPNDAAIQGLPAEHAEQDPARIRSLALDLLGRIARGIPEAPACLGLTGQMHGVLLADADLRPLTRLISWQDRRANAPVHGGSFSLLDTYRQRCPAETLADAGCRLAPGYGAVTLCCLREQGELPAGDWQGLTIADWLAAELCGGPRATDRTLAASLGALNLRQDRWSPEILAAGALEPAWMPEIRPSGERLGGLLEDFAVVTGLPRGLPVCVAVGDQQAAFLGSVPPGGNVVNLNIGTGGQISWELDRYRPVEGMEVRPLPPNGFLAVGAGVSGGDAYAWLQRTAAVWLRAFGVDREPDAIYSTLNALAAAAPPGAGGLRCEPSFRGTRRTPRARGSFAGVTNDNFDLGSVARAVLEGVVVGLFAFYEGAGEARPAGLERIIGSGNAFDKNPLLGRIVEQRFGSPVWRPQLPEAAARGAALLAGAGHGVWKDLDEARSAGAWRLDP